MTLDEAIEHAREVAGENRDICRLTTRENAPIIFECAEEHEQLAEWLEELKFLRQWKSDVMEEFCKYDCNSVEEVRHNAYDKAVDDVLFRKICDLPEQLKGE